MPRPKLPEDEKKNKYLRVRLHADEEKAIKRAAKRDRTPLSKWVRDRLLEAARKLG